MHIQSNPNLQAWFEINLLHDEIDAFSDPGTEIIFAQLLKDRRSDSVTGVQCFVPQHFS